MPFGLTNAPVTF
jgi:hypothetical protein